MGEKKVLSKIKKNSAELSAKNVRSHTHIHMCVHTHYSLETDLLI